jgi:flavodoxin I
MHESIGIFFASSTGSCETIARMIAGSFLPMQVPVHDVMLAEGGLINKYKNLIFGIPTWEKYELHEDWKEFLGTIPRETLVNKKVAIFGTADQHTYPDNFADALGLLCEWAVEQKATIVGHTTIEGYNFRHSLALRGKRFLGLVLDEDIQPHLTSERVSNWVINLKTQFDL